MLTLGFDVMVALHEKLRDSSSGHNEYLYQILWQSQRVRCKGLTSALLTAIFTIQCDRLWPVYAFFVVYGDITPLA